MIWLIPVWLVLVVLILVNHYVMLRFLLIALKGLLQVADDHSLG
jgi:hypothetical protein